MGARGASTGVFLSLVLGLMCAAGMEAQEVNPPKTTEEALKAMSQAAGVIFTGTVTAVRRPAASGGVVEIDFAVTEAVRGVAGGTYTLREWAGLWQGNDQPFRPGQRYLMLLHAPNTAGLSSPVGGAAGAIPIHGTGSPAIPAAPRSMLPRASRVRGTADVPVAEPGAPAGETIDLGWVAARVAVPVVYGPARPPVRPIFSPFVHAQTSAGPQAAEEPQPPTGLPASLPGEVRTAPYGSVLDRIRAWESNRHAIE